MSDALVVERPAAARALLRDATQATHLRLHRLPVFEALLDARLSRDGYRTLLLRLADFHVPFETMLSAHAARLAHEGFAVAEFRRAHRLHDDLAALPPSDAPSDDAAHTAAFPTPAGTAELFGMLYAREGSALGGRQMARALDPLLGDAAGGRSFLAGAATDGARWTRLCAALDRVAAAERGGLAAMTRGAEHAFIHFERIFTS